MFIILGGRGTITSSHTCPDRQQTQYNAAIPPVPTTYRAPQCYVAPLLRPSVNVPNCYCSIDKEKLWEDGTFRQNKQVFPRVQLQRCSVREGVLYFSLVFEYACPLSGLPRNGRTIWPLAGRVIQSVSLLEDCMT